MDDVNLKGSSHLVVGNKIRSLRQKKGMKISDFAAQIGVTSGHVSLIERNLIEPSLSVLRRISKVLDVNIPRLFSYETVSDIALMDRENCDVFLFPEGNLSYQFLTPANLTNGRDPQLSVAFSTCPPLTWDHTDFVVHGDYELLYVLKGAAEYHAGGSVYRLAKGDSLYLKGEIPHRIYNPSKSVSEYFTVFTSSPKKRLGTILEE